MHDLLDPFFNAENLIERLALVSFFLLTTLVLHGIAWRFVVKKLEQTKWGNGSSSLRHTANSSRMSIFFLVLLLLLPALGLEPVIYGYARHGITIFLICALAWFGISFVSGFDDVITSKYDISVKDNLRARRIHTQVRVVSRTIILFIVVLSIASVLMTFPRVRQLGAGLLASAGIAGLALGFAAKSFFENIFAGLQIAFTEPIRLGDAVIVENEWGWIEEITATYVVIKIWDERRLIVPLTYFLSKPFQNWTRKNADILGTVFLYVDYNFPVDQVRTKAEEFVKTTNLWDGRVCVTQVTDSKPYGMEIRILVSAENSPTAWDLRVWLREKLIEFLQTEFPEHLPKSRLEITSQSEKTKI